MNIRSYLVCACTAAALVAQARTWTLEECVAYAVANNLSVAAQEARLQSASLDSIEALDAFLPSVDATGSQSFNFGRGLTAENTYANRNTSSTSWGLGMSLPLFQGTRALRRVELSKLSLKQMLYERNATRDDIALNVISQYLQVLYNTEVVKTATIQRSYSAYEVERQRTLAKAGKIAEADVYDAEAQLAQDDLQLVSAQDDRRIALVNLANLLQLKSIDDMDVAPIDSAMPPLPGPDQIYDLAMNVNNGILGARQNMLVADKNIQLARAAYYPTLSMNAGLGSSFYTVSGMPRETFAQQMRHNMSTYVGFSLRIPIFDAFSARNGIRKAKVQRYSAQIELDRRESELYKTIQLAYYQAKGARERSETADTTLIITERSFEAVREKYNLGRATPVEFEQAKNKLFRTQVSRIQSRYEYMLRHRILEFYSKGTI